MGEGEEGAEVVVVSSSANSIGARSSGIKTVSGVIAASEGMRVAAVGQQQFRSQ